MTNNNNGGNDTNAAASGWLGFSLSPHMDEHQLQLQQQQQHGLFFPSVTAGAAASYGLGGGLATSASPYYTPQLASMPLKSDGSLCIMEALRRSDQQDHHGTYVRHIHTERMASRRPARWSLLLIDRRHCWFTQGPSSRTSLARRRRSRRPWR